MGFQNFSMPSNHSVFDFHTSDLSNYEEATPYAHLIPANNIKLHSVEHRT